MATVEINVASDSQKCKTYHFPCSYAQQRLWFMDQLEPGSPAYNISLALDFHGPLNVGALTSSLREIVRRHEALRTVFANIGGSPIQVVRENVEVPVPEIDLSSRDEREREAYRRELEQSESQQRFDLSTGPLLRMKLLRFHGSEHTLLLTFHHSVSDGWSMGVMVKELRALYEAFSESLPSPLEELPIQYPDYTLWQRESLAAGLLEEQLEYWKKQLDGLEPLEISGKSEVRDAIGPEALVEEVSFSTDLTSRLEQLSQQCNTTLFMTVLAAFQIVLARYTGQNDIAVGTPIAGRNASELEHLIGFFVNTLVLRTDLGGNPSVTELLERTRATAIQAYAHQDYPFELLVEQLQPERIIHSTPLFQVLFVLQNMPLEKIGLPGLKVNVRPIDSRIAKFDLSLSLWEVEGQLRGQLEYKSGLYTPPRARLLIKHLEKVMQAMVGDPAYRVHEIDCLTPGEKRQLLQEGNSTPDEDADHRSLHELFERHVRLKPDAPAVIHGSRTLTFIELNERANQLANFLRSKGVGTETQVALCLDRDPDMMVAVLGVLKAGAAYVPLDITHPEERLRYTLENSQAKLLLTKAPLLKCLPQQTTSIVCLDRDWGQIAYYTNENPNTVVFPDSLAYVIYTSGSTGKPKGVAMVHRAVTNLIQWQLSHRQAEQPRRTLQFTSLTFDVSFQEMFATWCMGGALVLVEDELRRDPQQLWDFLRVASIERLFLPFVALQQLAETLPATSRLDQISLREVITAGEQLKITPGIQKLFSMCSACTLDNQYGPTESHVVTAELLQGPAIHWPSLPSIGKPITNTQIYIFNQEMTLVPSDVPGELYIGGAALARGYLGKPDLTAERFVPDPLCTTAGSRLYRTGDIARWVNDEIEFLGRSDHQVKVRGYRVEPGEIEAVLADHAAVAQAVVVLREIAEEQKRLVGYVTLKEGQDGTSSRELRKHVQERLPEYIVPAIVMILEKMPLTASGKIDRKRLPVPKSLGAGDQRKYVGPRDEIEGIVSGIWEQVLKVERVGVEENFFELGGHSLLATQVISRVREAFGVELPLRVVFEEPTVAGMVKELKVVVGGGEQGRTSPPLVKVEGRGELPLSYGQQRLWFLEQLEPGNAVYNIPLALRLKGKVERRALEASFRKIVERHEVLRTVFEENQEQEVVQRVLGMEEVGFGVEEVELGGWGEEERKEEAGRIARQEAQQGFDLRRGPLVRVKVVGMGAEEHVLLVTMHHIVSDGWSLGVLVKEFQELYEGEREGRRAELEELEVQYGDYAVWQREWMQGEVLEEQLQYWREQLGGVEVLELPTDRVRGAVASHRGGRVWFELGEELTGKLKEVSRREGVTLFMVLLAGLQVLLQRYTGQEDIAVGTPIANRTRREIEKLIGFFVNTLVLRGKVKREERLGDLLKQAREITLAAYAHQDVPFEKLVEELQPTRDLSREPLFQVMLSLQNVPLEELRLPGLQIQSWENDEGEQAKFDLTFTVVETQNKLEIGINYAADLYELVTVQRLGKHWQRILETLSGSLDCQAGSVNLLSVEERKQVVEEWNRTEQEYPREQTIVRSFEQQVEQRPAAVAVVAGDRQLSYGELNRKGNQLAHYLRSKGVGPEVLVALCTERSVEMIVGMVGILKAGGAYIPMDMSYPKERLAWILEDTQAPVVLTHSGVEDWPPSYAGKIVSLDITWKDISRYSADNPVNQASGHDLAYVIYTSGSTGRPKGVAIQHSGLLNLVAWHIGKYELTGTDRTTQFASIGFDAAVWEIWPTLAAGASLWIVDEAARLNPAALPQWLQAKGTTVTFLPTPIAEEVMNMNWPSNSLRHLLTGGDTLHHNHSQLNSFILTNHYGPTENTVVATASVVSNHARFHLTPPIGKPIANTQVYVVDEEMEPVPVGVRGELYIGGEGVARGYVNRPELTAERFVPNPFVRGKSEPAAGQRLYRTGDQVRWLGDGNLEFMGRLDQQVKIRGFRIELGEIEAALQQCGGVRQAVVVAGEEEGGDKRLVAYVVGKEAGAAGGEELRRGELREQLQRRLPEYMVPSVYVELEELPLTPNGKLDRKRLPEPEGGEGRRKEQQGPRNAEEEIVSGIWEQVLKVERVGVEENFFELGGHSLLATQVISRVREAFGVELPLRVVFEEPTVAGMVKELKVVVGGGEQGRTSPPLVKVEGRGELPLSYGQQRLWFLEQLEPGNAVYNCPHALRIRGVLEREALEASFRKIVERHEVLRTVFEENQEQEVVQRVLGMEEVGFGVEEVELGGWGEEERKEEAGRIARQEAQQGFDLRRGPLVRVKVVGMGAEEHVLLVTMHHIVSDGWSLGVLVKEFQELYEGEREGRRAELEELEVQYGDYAVWQREWMQGEVLEEQLQYWREQLGGVEVLELPTDRVRGAVASHRGGRVWFELGEELTGKLKEVSRREGVTLFMVLLAGLQVLLQRYTGQEDIAVGTPIANRTRREIEKLIGFFVNTLVLRGKVKREERLGDLLKQAREITLAAYAHQDVPFEKLVEELQPTRDLSREPLFQVMLSLQNVPLEELRLPGLQIQSWENDEGEQAKFDLTFTVVETQNKLEIGINYAADLYELVTVQRLGKHWQRILETLSGSLDCQAGSVNLLSVEERKQVVEEWNRTEQEYPREQTIVRSFEQQVERRAAEAALRFEGQELTYYELNRRANQVARHLKRLGVQAEVRVGICMERSLDMVVGLLGILKAGGAYVPLDPEYPAERLAYMVENAQASILLAQDRVLSRLAAYTGRIVRLDTEWGQIAVESDTNLSLAPTGENLAYVIYTSGSTGKPKGAMNTHAGIFNRLWWMQQEYQLQAGERVLQKTPFSFDVSVWEFFWPLMTGACLVVARPGGHRDSSYLVNLIRNEEISTLHFVPSMLDVFLEEHGVEACQSLQRVICSGEALSSELKRKYYRRLKAGLHNLYGPTEAAVDVTSYACDKEEQAGVTVPIGKPIANTQVYVVDEEMEPVPVGVRGELYIGGEGVARGYVNRPELTAERFVPNPFVRGKSEPAAGQRLYRTGDQVRWLGDGNLEFMGRLDQQVKIRGFRIELGEIEAALQQCGGVRQAVVVAGEEEGGDKRLVAYVVGKEAGAAGGEELRRGELREQLQRRLPEYMVPSVYVELEELPLTPNGKLDRKRLPEPEGGEGRRKEQQGPRNAEEEIVSGIWEQVLKVERVGVEENFFELGGHSLLATQVISRVREAFGVELPLRVVFEEPTVAGMVKELKVVVGGGEQGRTSPPLVKVEGRGELPLSYGQQRLWFLEQLEPGNAVYNCPHALRIRGVLEREALEASFRKIVERHEVLRTVFEENQEQEVVQRVLGMEEVGFGVEEVELGGWGEEERKEEAGRIARQEAQQGFDLRRGPLVRVKVVGMGAEEHVLLVTMHHIVSDGWSLGVLVKEFQELYEGEREGRRAELEELEVQYGDYAVWQREWMQGEVLEEQLQYWREQLGGVEVLELPTDRVRGAVASHRGGRVRFELGEELTGKLKEVSRREGVTLFMVLLAGLQVLLQRYTGQEDIAVGTPIANRTRREIEKLIGFFVNTLVLRTRVRPAMSFRQLLAEVRDITLKAYAHQDVPFEKLVQELQPTRDLSREPLFQVMLVFQNIPVEQLTVTGAEITQLGSSEQEPAKFDLSFTFAEVGNVLQGSLVYAEDLFRSETAEYMVNHLQQILDSASRDMSKQIGHIGLMAAGERTQLLAEWNKTQREYLHTRTIVDLFEQCAEHNPEAVAIVDEHQEWSYTKLNQRANQLGRYLKAAGVGPEVRVGLCVERGLEMVMGILGILKAGGTYLPLDPDYPAERLKYMLEDAQAHVLLTQSRVAQRLPDFTGRIVQLDAAWEEICAYGNCNDVRDTDPANLAYVIYTSGSTGKPKGVGVTHESLTNFIVAMEDRIGSVPDGIWLAVTNLCFDISILELLWTLTKGVKVIIAQPRQLFERAAESPAVTHPLPEKGAAVTHLQCTPAMVKMFAAHPATQRILGSVQNLFIGGEMLPASTVAQLRQITTARLFNMYGPTETTIWSALYELPEGLVEEVPIGKPMANTQVYVLDGEMEPVPAGVAGELYIGGDGVSRGYLNRPELTGERFVPDPFKEAGGGGKRLYRTGDKARWRRDGNLEFLGRLDQQVKIRGHRIELGEIENVLQGHGRIRQAVAEAQEEESGEKRLVAYVVVGEGRGEVKSEELREYLRSKLPEYMVPVSYMQLEELPLTPSGKVDRKRLPKPGLSQGKAYVAPKTEIEEILCDIWAQALKREKVGTEDNFFEVGGDSIIGIQVITKANKAGIQLSARDLFRYQTVGQLANVAVAAKSVLAERPPEAAVREKLENTSATPNEFAVAEISPDQLQAVLQQMRKKKQYKTSKSVV